MFPGFALVRPEYRSSRALDADDAGVRPRHRRAVALMIVAAICWSTGGLLVRQLSITNAWEIVFWRSLFMAVFVAGVLVVMHGRSMPRAVRGGGMPGVVAGALPRGTFFFFIGSLTRTTVANTFVLMSVSPFLAAIAGGWCCASACRRTRGLRWPSRSRASS